MNKSQEAEDDSSSSFRRLPDEIVLEVLNKVMDLKSLCVCKLVSKRFNEIVLQVEALSFAVAVDSYDKFKILFSSSRELKSSRLFKGVKSLCIQVPCIDHPCLFKWKINFRNRFDSFIFLAPNSIYHKKELFVDENNQKEDAELNKKKEDIALKCFQDAKRRIIKLRLLIIFFPLLEKISITDSSKCGKISLSAREISEVRRLKSSNKKTSMEQYTRSNFLSCRMSRCYIPLLKLPVSGYMMNGVTLYMIERDDISSFTNFDLDDDFEDKEEAAAYREAMTEIMKNHWGRRWSRSGIKLSI